MMIDEELRSLIPALSDEEKKSLEASLKEDGCLHPITVWHVKPTECDECGANDFELDFYRPTEDDEGEDEWKCSECRAYQIDADEIVVDGHNRFEICERLGIRYDTYRLHFDSIDDAKIWMIRHQFARRNLQPFQRAELALKMEPLIASKAKANQVAGLESSGKRAEIKVPQKSAEPIETRKELAKTAGVSHDTIAKAKVIDAKADDKTKDDLRSGKTKINTVYKAIKEKEKADAAKTDGKPNDPKDKLGNPIPKSLIPIFADFKDELQAVITEATRIEAKALEIAKRKLSRRLADVFTPITRDGKDTFEQGDLGMFRHKVRKSMPHAVCIFCNGRDAKNCSITDPVTGRELKPCDSSGWMDKETFEKAQKVKKG